MRVLGLFAVLLVLMVGAAGACGCTDQEGGPAMGGCPSGCLAICGSSGLYWSGCVSSDGSFLEGFPPEGTAARIVRDLARQGIASLLNRPVHQKAPPPFSSSISLRVGTAEVPISALLESANTTILSAPSESREVPIRLELRQDFLGEARSLLTLISGGAIQDRNE